MAATDTYRELGEAAWSWVLGQVRGDDGPWLPETVPEDDGPVAPAEDRDSFYIGIGGLAPALAEIARHRALTDEELALAHGIVERLSTTGRPSAPSPPCTTGWPATRWRSGCSTRAARRSRSSGWWS